MRRILKYVVPMPSAEGLTMVELPIYSEILSVGVQGNDIVLWAKAPQGVAEPVWLLCRNTGDYEPDPERYVGSRFLGTVDVHGTVWHVWRVWR